MEYNIWTYKNCIYIFLPQLCMGIIRICALIMLDKLLIVAYLIIYVNILYSYEEEYQKHLLSLLVKEKIYYSLFNDRDLCPNNVLVFFIFKHRNLPFSPHQLTGRTPLPVLWSLMARNDAIHVVLKIYYTPEILMADHRAFG